MEVLGYTLWGIAGLFTVAIVIGLLREYFDMDKERYREWLADQHYREDQRWKHEPGVLRVLQRLRR